MAKVAIKATGTCNLKVPAERGTVHATISFEGPAAEPVYHAAATTLALARTRIEDLKQSGAVTWFSVDQVRRSAARPWNKDGVILPVVHSASVSLAVKFQDFAELSSWLAWGAKLNGLTISRIEWDLTVGKKAAVAREARQQAVRDAVRRAQDYADALDLGPVQVRAIKDSGSLGAAVVMSRGDLLFDGLPAPSEVVFAPEHIDVDAKVHAEFVVPTAP